MKTLRDIGIYVSGSAGEQRTTCPACSESRRNKKEKCLSVNLETQRWHCFHCGFSGDMAVINALENQERERERKRYMPIKHVHVDLPQDMIDHMKARGISEEIMKLNGICLGDVYDHETKKKIRAIKFPYYKGGHVVNAKHKTLCKKFRQEANAEACLYRFDSILDNDYSQMVLCEGEMDALSCQAAGIPNASSVPNGAPAISAKNYEREFDYLESAQEIFERMKKVVLAVDGDAPGKKLEQELARRIGVEKCYRVSWPKGCKDANDVLVKMGPNALMRCIQNAEPYPVSGIFTPSSLTDLVLSLYDCGEQRGLPTGWPIFDSHYTVKSGQITIVTGIPGHGKSNFVDALAVNLCKSAGWRFAVFSPENWPLQRHMQSLVEKLSEKPFWGQGRITRGEVEEWIDGINDRFYFLMPDEDEMSVEAILERVRICVFRHGVRGVILDPWNEFDHVQKNGETETQYISRTIGKLRRFARRNDVHIWVIAHPQKLQKDKESGSYAPPTMYEISGGAHWRNKADMGLCIHRPDMTKDETIVFVQKVRFRECGKLGGVKFRYSRECGVYRDVSVVGMSNSVNDSGRG